MIFAAFRPRFELPAPGTQVDEALERLVSTIERDTPLHSVRVLDHHVDIELPASERRVWSPCLQFDLVEREEGGLVARGHVGPQPDVWTLYVVALAHFVFAGAFALLFGLVQLTLDATPWGLWITGGCVGAAAGMYLLARLGRRLASEQTERLLDLLARAWDEGARA